MESASPLRIAIIGGGIGGLALAIALSKHTHLITTIYEARYSFGEIGAGVALSANAQDAMRRIDPRLHQAFFNGVASFDDVFFNYLVGAKGHHEGERVVKVHLQDKTVLGTAHRAHVLDMLVKLLPELENLGIEFNKRLISVSKDGSLQFADGTEAEADLVVGCDGIRSVCRTLVFPSDDVLGKAHFAGMVAYRGLIPMALAEEVLGKESAHDRTIHMGPGGHIIMFPIANGTLVNVVAMHTRESWDSDHWIQPAQAENARRDFDTSRWTEKVAKVIELCKDPDAWALFHHLSTPTFHSSDGRMVLLGDAAHSTCPHYGQGASMAFEDAFVLAGLLGQCHAPADLQKALEAYDSVRVPRANKIVQKSFERCKRMCLVGDVSEDDLPRMAREWDYTPDWIWHQDMGQHLAQALCKFREGK